MVSDDEPGDLARCPLAYPGRRVARSVLVTRDGEYALTPVLGGGVGQRRVEGAGRFGRPGTAARSLERELLVRSEAGIDARLPVVAVGSNGSAQVVRAKLAAACIDPVFPMVTGSVEGLAVGHSAHVSSPGYVPAAPFGRPGARTSVVVSWMTDRQVDGLDLTEPNYRRATLCSTRYRLTLDAGEVVDRFAIYVSAWGVLAEQGRPVEFMESQDDVARWLADRAVQPWDALGARGAAGALAAGDDLRVRVRDTLRRRGLVADAALS